MKKNWKILGGGGVHHRPSGMEIPGGWGVKTERPSVGGIWIFSGNTHLHILNNSVNLLRLLMNAEAVRLGLL